MSEQPPAPAGGEPESPPPAPAYPVAAYPTVAPGAAGWQAPTAPGRRPPGPAPGLVYAGFALRLLGYIMDIIVLFVIEAPITIPFVYVPIARYYQAHPPAAGQTVATLPVDLSNRFLLIGLFGALASAVYFGGLVTWQGRTIGQRAMGTFVVRAEDGGRLPLGPAYLRAVIFWGPGVVGLIPTAGSIAGLIALIGLLSAAWDQRKQGWHDKLARSLVVKRVPM